MMRHAFQYTHRGVTTRLTAVADGIIRATRTGRDAFGDKASAVVVCPADGMGALTETDAEIRFTVGPVTVRIAKQTGAACFENAHGEVLLREPDRRPHLLAETPVYLHRYDRHSQVAEGSSVDGARASATASEVVLDRVAYECRQNFVFDAREGLYGLGSHEEGYGNLRGKSRLLYQHNRKAVVPMLISTKGYGLLFDMGCQMAFHDDEQGSYLWADCADEMDWYFLYGDGGYPSLMALHRRLTGAASMLPRYARGYIQSKERDVDATEMMNVAEEYRRRRVPLDMIVLDWQSWPEGQWGWKHFDETRFSNPSALTRQLHDIHVRMMLSIWPSMGGERNEDRKAMLEKGFMLGNKLIYDAFNPAARELYWQQTNQELFSKGVDAWWCDCSEPFESDWHGAIKPEPLIRARLNTDEAKRYLDPAQISLYSLYHSQGIYEGQRSVTQDKRVCNLTRSSWVGQHRYATITWSGDVSASWETLRRHIPEGLNFCVTGEPYWSTDIGAFFPNGDREPWFYEGDFDAGVADLGYRELYVRWAQYAAFLPMMRSHGTGTPREIWQFGEKGEPFYDALEKTIRLRYHLIPYLYSLMARTCQAGTPMLCPPALIFPEDDSLRQVDDQMLLGDYLLVKPVTHPMYYLPDSRPIPQTNEQVNVRLPSGHTWYNLYTGTSHDGGQTITVSAPLDRIPAFVRGGSILPWGAEVQHTDELADAPLELIIFPGEDGRFTLYDDAGDGYGYEQGEYTEVPLHWEDKTSQLHIGQRVGSYPGIPHKRLLRVHRVGGAVEEIEYTGQGVTVTL